MRLTARDRRTLCTAVGLLSCLGCSGLFPDPEPTMSLLLRSDLPVAEEDAQVFADRLARSPGSGRVRVLDPHHVQLDVADLEAHDLGRLTPRNRLEVGPIRNTHIASATVSTEPSFGSTVVLIQLDDVGAALFCTHTTDRVDQPLPVVLDGETLVAPVVRTPLCGGSFVITQGMSANLDDTQHLAYRLNGPALRGRWDLAVQEVYREAPLDIPIDPYREALPTGYERTNTFVDGPFDDDTLPDRAQLLSAPASGEQVLGLFMSAGPNRFHDVVRSGPLHLPSTSANPALHVEGHHVVLTVQGRDDVTRQFHIGVHPDRRGLEVLQRSEVYFGLDEARQHVDYVNGTRTTTSMVDGVETTQEVTFPTAAVPLATLTSTGVVPDPAFPGSTR